VAIDDDRVAVDPRGYRNLIRTPDSHHEQR
jgi:hypothetical protein